LLPPNREPVSQLINGPKIRGQVTHDRRSLRGACIRAISDGPFQGDLVAGYWLWELPSIEDAVVWVKRCPNPMPEPWEIEIRPI